MSTRDASTLANLSELAKRARQGAVEALAAPIPSRGAARLAVLERQNRALRSEMLTWVAAHGSKALRSSVRQALALDGGQEAGRVSRVADAEVSELEKLRPRIASEWLAQNRPGWVSWEPLSNATREDMRENHNHSAWRDRRSEWSNPAELPAKDLGRLVGATAVRELLAMAQQTEAAAVLATYERQHGGRDGRQDKFYCAIAQTRLPGDWRFTQIAMLKCPNHERVASRARERAQADRDGVQQLRERVQLEFGKPVLAVPVGAAVVGRVARLDTSAGSNRAIIESDKFVCVVSLGDTRGQPLVGKSVTLENRAGRICISERTPRLAVGRPPALER